MSAIIPLDPCPEIKQNQSQAPESVLCEYACVGCGSTYILWDAVVEWDLAKQAHVLVHTHDIAECQDCSGSNIVKRKIQ